MQNANPPHPKWKQSPHIHSPRHTVPDAMSTPTTPLLLAASDVVMHGAAAGAGSNKKTTTPASVTVRTMPPIALVTTGAAVKPEPRRRVRAAPASRQSRTRWRDGEGPGAGAGKGKGKERGTRKKKKKKKKVATKRNRGEASSPDDRPTTRHRGANRYAMPMPPGYFQRTLHAPTAKTPFAFSLSPYAPASEQMLDMWTYLLGILLSTNAHTRFPVNDLNPYLNAPTGDMWLSIFQTFMRDMPTAELHVATGVSTPTIREPTCDATVAAMARFVETLPMRDLMPWEKMGRGHAAWINWINAVESGSGSTANRISCKPTDFTRPLMSLLHVTFAVPDVMMSFFLRYSPVNTDSVILRYFRPAVTPIGRTGRTARIYVPTPKMLSAYNLMAGGAGNAPPTDTEIHNTVRTHAARIRLDPSTEEPVIDLTFDQVQRLMKACHLLADMGRYNCCGAVRPGKAFKRVRGKGKYQKLHGASGCADSILAPFPAGAGGGAGAQGAAAPRGFVMKKYTASSAPTEINQVSSIPVVIKTLPVRTSRGVADGTALSPDAPLTKEPQNMRIPAARGIFYVRNTPAFVGTPLSKHWDASRAKAARAETQEKQMANARMREATHAFGLLRDQRRRKQRREEKRRSTMTATNVATLPSAPSDMRAPTIAPRFHLDVVLGAYLSGAEIKRVWQMDETPETVKSAVASHLFVRNTTPMVNDNVYQMVINMVKRYAKNPTPTARREANEVVLLRGVPTACRGGPSGLDIGGGLPGHGVSIKLFLANSTLQIMGKCIGPMELAKAFRAFQQSALYLGVAIDLNKRLVTDAFNTALGLTQCRVHVFHMGNAKTTFDLGAATEWFKGLQCDPMIFPGPENLAAVTKVGGAGNNPRFCIGMTVGPRANDPTVTVTDATNLTTAGKNDAIPISFSVTPTGKVTVTGKVTNSQIQYAIEIVYTLLARFCKNILPLDAQEPSEPVTLESFMRCLRETSDVEMDPSIAEHAWFKAFYPIHRFPPADLVDLYRDAVVVPASVAKMAAPVGASLPMGDE